MTPFQRVMSVAEEEVMKKIGVWSVYRGESVRGRNLPETADRLCP